MDTNFFARTFINSVFVRQSSLGMKFTSASLNYSQKYKKVCDFYSN